MIIVDTALKKREAEGRPIRVGMIGTGYIGRGIARQLLTPLSGIRLVAIAGRRCHCAASIFEEAGQCPGAVENVGVLEDAIAAGLPAVTENAELLCQSESIDVLIECTGQVEFGAKIATTGIDHGKHIILVNAELDATVGPILKARADKAGVVLTNTDGDEPGVAMNLVRFVETIGYCPVMAGNIKGFYDPRRNPDTQAEFARKTGQNARMVTSFADGTKLSMETTILANATGFRAGRRGMFGHCCDHVKDILDHFRPEELLNQGLVEFVLGAEPGTGAFVVGYNDQPNKQEYMRYFKMGDGPLYLFYTPFHLTHLEVAITVARTVLFHDAAIAPIGPPVCDVLAVAKRNLIDGEVLDGIGGFTCYGMIDNAERCAAEDCLPMGLAEGCLLKKPVAQDEPIRYSDVVLPPGRLCDALREEQNARFRLANVPTPTAPERLA